MLRTYEALLQPNGQIQFLDHPAESSEGPRHVLVTFTEGTPGADMAACGAKLSESALAEDWLREEEDIAWAHLQAGK
ncbi:MAG: hypothetical protein FGM40_06370 [Rhodocyclaceae bacterium]|nr:hypothetical protein [Rhodocyclaceae bacterium]